MGMKDKPVFDPKIFIQDKMSLEIAALVHLLPVNEKAEILEIVRSKVLRMTVEKEKDPWHSIH